MLLSQNRTLAPFELIQVSKELPGPIEATKVYNFGENARIDTWCTDNNDPDPHVELGFTSPVLITAMISGGRIGLTIFNSSLSLGTFYVTNFTLEYSYSTNTNDSSDWTFYTTKDLETKVYSYT